jgi:hypothetical protein
VAVSAVSRLPSTPARSATVIRPTLTITGPGTAPPSPDDPRARSLVVAPPAGQLTVHGERFDIKDANALFDQQKAIQNRMIAFSRAYNKPGERWNETALVRALNEALQNNAAIDSELMNFMQAYQVTDANLQRALAMIYGLEKQLEQADRFRNEQGDVASQARIQAGGAVATAGEALAANERLRKDKEALEQQKAQIEEALRANSEELSRLQTGIDEELKNLDRIANRSGDFKLSSDSLSTSGRLHEYVTHLGGRVDAMSREIVALSGQAAESKAAADQLQKQITTLTREKEAYLAEQVQTAKDMVDLKAKTGAAEAKAKDTQATLDRREKELKAAEEKTAVVQAELDKVNAAIRKNAGKLDTSAAQAIEEMQAKLTEETKLKQAAKDELKKATDDYDAKLKAANAELGSTKALVAGAGEIEKRLETSLVDAQKSIGLLRKELSEKDARIRDLEATPAQGGGRAIGGGGGTPALSGPAPVNLLESPGYYALSVWDKGFAAAQLAKAVDQPKFALAVRQPAPAKPAIERVYTTERKGEVYEVTLYSPEPDDVRGIGVDRSVAWTETYPATTTLTVIDLNHAMQALGRMGYKVVGKAPEPIPLPPEPAAANFVLVAAAEPKGDAKEAPAALVKIDPSDPFAAAMQMDTKPDEDARNKMMIVRPGQASQDAMYALVVAAGGNPTLEGRKRGAYIEDVLDLDIMCQDRAWALAIIDLMGFQTSPSGPASTLYDPSVPLNKQLEYIYLRAQNGSTELLFVLELMLVFHLMKENPPPVRQEHIMEYIRVYVRGPLGSLGNRTHIPRITLVLKRFLVRMRDTAEDTQNQKLFWWTQSPLVGAIMKIYSGSEGTKTLLAHNARLRFMFAQSEYTYRALAHSILVDQRLAYVFQDLCGMLWDANNFRANFISLMDQPGGAFMLDMFMATPQSWFWVKHFKNNGLRQSVLVEIDSQLRDTFGVTADAAVAQITASLANQAEHYAPPRALDGPKSPLQLEAEHV